MADQGEKRVIYEWWKDPADTLYYWHVRVVGRLSPVAWGRGYRLRADCTAAMETIIQNTCSKIVMLEKPPEKK